MSRRNLRRTENSENVEPEPVRMVYARRTLYLCAVQPQRSPQHATAKFALQIASALRQLGRFRWRAF